MIFSTVFYPEQFRDGSATYNNFVTSFTSESGEITRQSFLKLKVACRMDKESVSQIMYLVEHNDNSSLIGSGSFNTSMKFYTSSGFYYEVRLGSEAVTVGTEDSSCFYKLLMFYFHIGR